MRKANEIVICRDEYDNQHDFEEMIKNAVMLLLNNDYIATIRYDEKSLGIVAIEYDYDDVIDNSGTLEELEHEAKRFVERWNR